MAWDTNLKRVIGRFFFGTRQALIDEGSFEAKFMTPRKSLNAALMDFGSALCVAQPKCEACPLRFRCVYYRERGKQEEKKKTMRLTGRQDWTEARAIVILHEKHRQYYSSNQKKYQPFLLPKGYATRTGIKAYFERHYGLTLSVRPPHAKQLIRGKLTLSVNAQILLGKPNFQVFPKSAISGYNRGIDT